MRITPSDPDAVPPAADIRPKPPASSAARVPPAPSFLPFLTRYEPGVPIAPLDPPDGLTADEQLARFEMELKFHDPGHQPC